MSLEQVIEHNTAAMNELTKAILGGKGSPTPATGTGTAGKPATASKPAAPKAPKVNFEAVTAQCVQVKEQLGEDKAKELIKEFGGTEKLRDVPKENWDALHDGAKAALEAAAADAPADDGL